MFSHRLYLKIIFNTLLILVILGSGVMLIISRWAIIIGILLLIWAVFQVQHLINLLNSTNKRISLFFDTIQDNGAQGYFPEENVDKEEEALNRTFNRINQIINENKRQSQKQELLYKALLEHIPSGIIAWDTNGKILIVNQAALRLLGYNFLNNIQQVGERYPEFKQIITPADLRHPADIKINTEREHRQLAIVKSSMVLQEQRITLLSLQDIREQLNEKESESWIKLTHVLTHEIMNSIAPITSLSETLSSYFETNGIAKNREEVSDQIIQKTVKGLSIVKRRGKSLLHFAESYRKLTFIPTPAIRPFTFCEFADNLHHLLQPQLEVGQIEMQISILPANLVVNANEELLSQVLINLIKNAIQALEGHSGGKIQLSAWQTERLLIQVTDNGPGISATLLEDIFVPFFTTKSSGSGIGLSLSRQIIRLHGGELTASSTPCGETCFSISLPGT